jgi:hypothetical protein
MGWQVPRFLKSTFLINPLPLLSQDSTLFSGRSVAFRFVVGLFAVSPSATYPGSSLPWTREHLWHLQIGNAIQERASLLFFASAQEFWLDLMINDQDWVFFFSTGGKASGKSMGVMGGSFLQSTAATTQNT